jgi:unconventional prefoldin RPB5 interactor 1
MATIKDSFVDLERHRQILEENVDKLRSSLGNWRLWEAEYDALRTEVTELPKPASSQGLARIRRDFDGQLVDQKEVREIFGRTDLRSSEQIVGVLSRRLDYVSQNVQTLETQLEAAENKLAATSVVSQPDATHEDGEPVMDIIEQLDDDGNVLSFRLQSGSDSGPQLLEALEKAGIKELPESKQMSASESMESPPEASAAASNEVPPELTPESSATPPKKSRPAKKGVTFAEDTKPGHDTSKAPKANNRRSTAARRMENIMRAAKAQGSSMPSSAVYPPNESAEDARMRRDMMDYATSDIGPIVAELELDEVDSQDEEWVDDNSDLDDDDDEDEDDEKGISKYSAISDDYRQRMMELEAKLSSQSFFTSSKPTFAETNEGVGRVAVTPGQEVVHVKEKGKENPEPFSESSERPYIAKRKTDPLTDIVERINDFATPAQRTPRRNSKFKARRGAATTAAKPPEDLPKGPLQAPKRFLETPSEVTAPTGPEGEMLASSIVERPPAKEATDPVELEARLRSQELATEYHQARNRVIQQHGGFLQENKSAAEPLGEEGGRKMSRFKAARLSKH